MPQTKTKLLPSKHYLDSLIDSIKNARVRISIIALVVADDSTTKFLIDEIEKAAQRGVDVSIVSDLYFTYSELRNDGKRTDYFRKQVRGMRKLKKRLAKAGASVHWIGENGITFFSRRTHTKWSIVDDTVYSFGGVNLHYFGIESCDYMFKVNDKTLADTLIAEQIRILNADKHGHSMRSYSFNYGKKDTVLLDGGLMGASIIYKRACKLAAQAESITYVSQYCPTGKLNRLLKKKKSSIYFNPWQNADRFNRALIRWSMFVNRQQTSYLKKQYLHAKFMIFTMPDDTKIALTGSHNFVSMGVLLGTREVALETRNPEIIAQIETFFKDNVA